MRVLVTGAAGFIGSHAVERLVRRGDDVVGIDNFNDYYSPARKRANVEAVRAVGEFEMVEGDIRDGAAVEALFAGKSFDAVIHLAAMAGVRNSVEFPILYYDVNVNGTIRLLEAARKHGVGTFVFASTSSVYGPTQTIPFVETDPCNQPLAPYPASKKACEGLAYAYHHLHKMNLTGVRFFTVYGPRGRPDMMLYKVAESAFTGKPVPLYNRGEMHRDWTYVDDIVSGVVAAAERPLGFELINLGRGEPVLLADFVRQIEALAGRPANLVPAPMPDADIAYTWADISKAHELLGYNPQTPVAEGVPKFMEWYRKIKDEG